MGFAVEEGRDSQIMELRLEGRTICVVTGRLCHPRLRLRCGCGETICFTHSSSLGAGGQVRPASWSGETRWVADRKARRQQDKHPLEHPSIHKSFSVRTDDLPNVFYEGGKEPYLWDWRHR